MPDEQTDPVIFHPVKLTNSTTARSLPLTLDDRVIFKLDHDACYHSTLNLSADGRQLAYGNTLWDISFEEIIDFCDREGYCLTFSPNQRVIASASRDGIITLWDACTFTCQGNLLGHRDFIVNLAFSPDGQTLVSSSDDGTIRLWDTSTLTQKGIIAANWDSHLPYSYDAFGYQLLTFSPHGRTLAVGNCHGVELWDVSTLTRRTILQGHDGFLTAIAFNPEGTFLASASRSGHKTLQLWNTSVGENPQVLIEHSGDIHSLAFSPDGDTLISGGWDGTLQFWDIPALTLRRTIREESTPVRSVAFSPDGTQFALARGWDDGEITVILYRVG